MHSSRRTGFVQNKLSYIGYLTGFFFLLWNYISFKSWITVLIRTSTSNTTNIPYFPICSIEQAELINLATVFLMPSIPSINK